MIITCIKYFNYRGQSNSGKLSQNENRIGKKTPKAKSQPILFELFQI